MQEIKMSPEFIQYCLNRLTAAELRIYLAVRSIFIEGGIDLTRAVLTKLCDMSNPEHASARLKRLIAKGFVTARFYQGGTGRNGNYGITIAWIRTTENEPVPQQPSHPAYIVISPEGRRYQVRCGSCKEFERKHGLRLGSIYQLVTGWNDSSGGYVVAPETLERMIDEGRFAPRTAKAKAFYNAYMSRGGRDESVA